MSTNIQISARSLDVIRQISERKGLDVSEVLDCAVETYRREVLLDETSMAFHALKENAEAWVEELNERELWETSIGDGLESE